MCEECFKKIELKAKSQYCLHCKRKNTYGEFCFEDKEDYALNGVWIAANYDNPLLSEVIKKTKYNFSYEAAPVLGKVMAAFFYELFAENTDKDEDAQARLSGVIDSFEKTSVIPVPLHKKRKNWRGFNQAELIAGQFASRTYLPLITDKLVRIKYLRPQAGLKEKERVENIKSCFIWKGENLMGKNIILIDDVVTTGSTLNECAKVLKENGAGEVWGLVVAKG